MSLRRALSTATYLGLAKVGRRFGGVRPFRLMNKLRDAGWSNPPVAGEFWTVTDRWGCAMQLHPFYLIDHNIIARGTYDLPLHRYIERHVHAGMAVFDVGANIGSVALHFSRRVGPEGKVTCFEPVPHVLQRLRENVAANDFAVNVCIEPLGLWESSGTVEISIPPPQLPNHGCASMVRTTENAAPTAIAVTSLDDYVTSHQLERLNLIKFDIQGAEAVALRGAARCLQTFRPTLLTEVSANDLRAHGLTSRDYLRQIEELGYKCHTMLDSGDLGEAIDPKAIPEHAHFANVVCMPA
jgi:FkbM family methyltransferase